MARLEDLPVAIELPEPLAGEVAAYVESEAGWQVVAPGGPPEPVLSLTAVVDPARRCVVVVDGTVPAGAARDALLVGALDVIGWPGDRERLLDAPLRVREHAPPRTQPRVLRVAGAAGGVGTSTVALAVAGLLTWAGARVAVLGDDGLLALCGLAPWRGPGAAELAALSTEQAAVEFVGLARPVPGVPGLVGLGSVTAQPDARGWPVDAVVQDAGRLRDGACDLLVARADGRLTPPVVEVRRGVVMTEGPLGRARVRRRLGAAPAAWLPWSHRVTRAGLAGRVPASLPGTWLRALRAVAAA